MPIEVPWITKKRASAQQKSPRDLNTPEENKLLDLAKDRFESAKRDRTDFDGRPLEMKWRQIDEFHRGKQWGLNDVPPHMSTPVLNFVFALLESAIPRMTDGNPDFLILPRRGGPDDQLAKDLTAIQKYIWYINRMHEETLDDLVMPMLKYGTVIGKTIFDQSMSNGLGDVRYSVVHPEDFYPDPRAYSIDEMEFCFTEVFKSQEFLARRWPEKGYLVTPDGESHEKSNLQGRDKPRLERGSWLKEYWFRDEENRICVMYYANDVVLDVIGGKLDKYRPNEPALIHNRFPFTRFLDYPMDKSFWGIGEVELVLLLQQLINSLEGQVIDNTRLMSNAEWVISKVASGLKEEDAWIFDGRPNNVIFTQNGGVEKVPGVSVPAHIVSHIEQLIYYMEQILGIHDVVQGRRPVGVRAASAIIALQESANTRITRKTKRLGGGLREMVEQSIYLVLDNYDGERQFRMTGSNAPVTLNVRKALVQSLYYSASEAGELPETITPGLTPEQVGMMPEELTSQLVEHIRFPDFDVEVKIGPSIPYSKALLWEQAKELYQLGAIDRRAVLEVSGFPNWEAILARMEGAEAAAAGVEERVGEMTFRNPQQGGVF